MRHFTASESSVLDNFYWRALDGSQSRFTLGTATARRLAPGFAPLSGFAVPQQPDFEALAQHCQAGDRLHCVGWDGVAPTGWRIESHSTLCRMVWDGPSPDSDRRIKTVRIEPQHLPQILDLVERARPGPFGPRSLELGEYFGCFAAGRLVAMAGERLHAGRFREISGVCTDSNHRGQGLAQALVSTLVRQQMYRDETPLLHVRSENLYARRFYEWLGFREYGRYAVCVVTYMGVAASR
jgi:ribosomal protein S18 acetylase RimI-like enzyme